jgi:hypothetical protein
MDTRVDHTLNIAAGSATMVRSGGVQLDPLQNAFHAQRKGRCLMALGIYFMHEGFTPEKYDSAIQKLEEAGAGSPKGRTFHTALESDGSIQVFDIWESQAEFEAFGSTLMPILAELGVTLGEPMISTVHNLLEG